MSVTRTAHTRRVPDRQMVTPPQASRGFLVVPQVDERPAVSASTMLDHALKAEISAIASHYQDRDYRNFEFDAIQQRIFQIEAEA